MKGACEACAREETCRKEIGVIWGFCNTDFIPKQTPKVKEIASITAKDTRIIVVSKGMAPVYFMGLAGELDSASGELVVNRIYPAPATDDAVLVIETERCNGHNE